MNTLLSRKTRAKNALDEVRPLRRGLGLALVLAAAATSGLSLSACNTAEGIGEDVEDAGDAIEDAADDAR